MFQVVVIDKAVEEGTSTSSPGQCHATRHPVALADPFAFLAEFPAGSKLISARPHGASSWTRTARIDLELSDESRRSLFLNVARGDDGLGMLRGEYHGVSALYKIIPNGIPRPIAWGTYKADPNSHFYLCEFVDMIEELPDIRQFCRLLAKLHHDSMVARDAPKKIRLSCCHVRREHAPRCDVV